MADHTPELIERLRADAIGCIAACLQDLEVYLDVAEEYGFLPQDKIDICRSKMKNPFKQEEK